VLAPAAIAASQNGDASKAGLPELDRVQRHLKTESLDQAKRRLQGEDAQFHLFLNEDSGEVNVIYRRADGGLRVIEPVVK
jgi:hypothetical protein